MASTQHLQLALPLSLSRTLANLHINRACQSAVHSHSAVHPPALAQSIAGHPPSSPPISSCSHSFQFVSPRAQLCGSTACLHAWSVISVVVVPALAMAVFGLLLLVVLLLMLVLLPDAVSANAGVDDAVGASAAGGAPPWAAPAAVLATLRSLSLALQSLFNRLASTRLERGDAAGAERARNIANTVGNGMQWWAGLGTVSWDYMTNYVLTQSISRGMGVSQALSQLATLSGIVGEVTQLRTDGDRLQWISRNYARVFGVAKSTMTNLLTVFDHDGAIRNCVLAIQRELLEGDLLKDVLRLGPNDLAGIVGMMKDVLQRTFAPPQQGR